MLLVILGAGASYDSAPYHMLDRHPPESYPWRPPLADHLFARPAFQPLLARYPHALALLPQLTGVAQGTPLERILDKLQGEAKSHPLRRSQLTAVRFYLRDLLIECRQRWLQETSSHTNYFPLLDQLQEWREKSGEPICIVTFNYDVMLEDALFTVGVDTSTLEGYVGNDHWKIIKPHGSSDWARPVDTPIQPATVSALIKLAEQGIYVSERYVIARQGEVTLGDRMLIPAIAIPLESGKDFECPSDHLTVLEDCIRQTTHMLIIGWRATEKRFLQMLARIMPTQMRFQMHIACGDHEGASRTWNNLQQAGVGQNAVLREYGGFSQLMRSEDLRTMLLATG